MREGVGREKIERGGRDRGRRGVHMTSSGVCCIKASAVLVTSARCRSVSVHQENRGTFTMIKVLTVCAVLLVLAVHFSTQVCVTHIYVDYVYVNICLLFSILVLMFCIEILQNTAVRKHSTLRELHFVID